MTISGIFLIQVALETVNFSRKNLGPIMVYSKQSLVIAVVWVSGFIFLAAINDVLASFFTVGPKRCQECHVEETKIWGGTAKFSGYKKIHRIKNAEKFLKAIGDKRMKKVADMHHVPLYRGSKTLKKETKNYPWSFV